ncbi:class A beta-lactamase [Dyella caseinilytica]|uniref:Beta-lactamase n=1 Tax=Dyella caseinilytica TaxID=1849581 RepID=A0ABX7GQ42_9GAMM|nr:class A beta-lactamase [Dyella caseinilytica]QRN52113.1 class A beta-lactamase [Dyella caseinilytica]GGA15291.1 beta-lactamase [Dyella caseinilytica]
MKFPSGRTSALAATLFALTSAATPSGANATDLHVTAASQTNLQTQLEMLARRARPGTLGIAVLDLDSGKTWRVNADQSYPMMSVFKPAVAAALLDRIERGQNNFDQTVTLTRADLENGIIRKQFQGTQMTFTVRQLMSYMVSQSDNTSVDALLKLMGGPAVVASYLHAHGIDDLRVDRGEAGNAQLFEALRPGETLPANETDAQQDQRYLRGYHMFLADPGNRSTPDGAVLFLRKLWQRRLLSSASTQYLLDLMYAQTMPNRLMSGLPAGVKLADKCGTSETWDGLTAAYNDIGIMTWPDGHTVIVAAFLTASNAPEDQRHALFVELAKSISAALHPSP